MPKGKSSNHGSTAATSGSSGNVSISPSSSSASSSSSSSSSSSAPVTKQISSRLTKLSDSRIGVSQANQCGKSMASASKLSKSCASHMAPSGVNRASSISANRNRTARSANTRGRNIRSITKLSKQQKSSPPPVTTTTASTGRIRSSSGGNTCANSKTTISTTPANTTANSISNRNSNSSIKSGFRQKVASATGTGTGSASSLAKSKTSITNRSNNNNIANNFHKTSTGKCKSQLQKSESASLGGSASRSAATASASATSFTSSKTSPLSEPAKTNQSMKSATASAAALAAAPAASRSATVSAGTSKKTEMDAAESNEDNNALLLRETFKSDPKLIALFEKKKYKIIKLLGKGSYGQVYKGVRTDTGTEVAIKVVWMAKLGAIFRQKYLPQELAALINTQHANVVRTLDIMRADDKLFVIMEFCPNGDLRGYLAKFGPIAERLAQYWFAQIVDALCHFHRHLRMAHRDIKLENVLLDAQHDTKLADFGFAKETWDSARHCVALSQTVCGTLAYFSPQLLQQMPYNAYAADAWACGVMLFVLLNMQFPFSQRQLGPDEQKCSLLEMTNYPTFLRTKMIASVTPAAVDITVRLLDPDERSRMSLHQAKQHDFVAAKKSIDRSSIAPLLCSKIGKKN